MKTRGPITVYLCAVIFTVLAIDVQTPQKYVEAPRGKSAKLPCTYKSTTTDLSGGNAMWAKGDTEVIADFFGTGVVNSDDAYKGRVSFSGNVYANDASIVIDKLTMEDNGTYQCEITIPKDRTGTRQAKIDLVVLVAPSKPDCAIVGTAEYGQVIQLTCNSREGSPPPQYTWKSYTPQDAPRALPATSVTEGGSLTLKNISMETSGFFICTSTNRIGEDSCNLTLAVMPPSMNMALYAGVIGGSVAGIIVIGIIVYCCCCRDADEKEEYEMAEGEEDEEAPNPPQKAQIKRQQEQQQQQYYQDDDDDETNLEDNDQHGPPMPPPNKPKLVINA
ncbi:cell surface A33 antigen [Pyxicephalus adspersus]|uniref:cell surface A33 antigen n=1 Tax=Pyxicephalus adspersus TaxID=30357 RepID=UPI003B5CD44A